MRPTQSSDFAAQSLLQQDLFWHKWHDCCCLARNASEFESEKSDSYKVFRITRIAPTSSFPIKGKSSQKVYTDWYMCGCPI